jgi:hypothetical protein
MTVRIAKQPVNIREKLSELERPIGLKGSELMRAETAQEARDFVSAGRKNLIINGKMEIAQRATSATNIGSSFTYYTLDRWIWRSNGHGGRFTMSQDSDTPSGFYKSLKLEVTTADDSLTSNHYQGLAQRFETFDIHQLGYGTPEAKPVTLSFWVKSSLPGTYSCHFSFWNSSPGRNISKPYTINQANTWEKKIITFEGDTSTEPTSDNTLLAAELGWCFTTTSFYNDGTDGSVWHDTSDAGKRHSGHVVNLSANTGTTWYLTGVQLEVGKNATEFEHRSYGEELALCQRYFLKLGGESKIMGMGSGTTLSTTQGWGVVQFPVTMRTYPTAALLGGTGVTLSNGTVYPSSPTLGVQYAGTTGSMLTFGYTAGTYAAANQGTVLYTQNGATDGLTFNAEL